MQMDCFKCKHFKVTWDPQNPRGCAAYGFKTKQLPSVVVKQSSGMDCMKFTAKSESGRK
ncbi:MAG: uracil-DNA glycosylase [Lysinibacillus sp.]